MKKFFLQELKRNLWTFVLLTAVCTVPYLATVSTMSLRNTYWSPEGTAGTYVASDPCLSLVNGMAIALCYLAPIFVYSFKMNKRSVDAYYALPLKKEKLYFVRAAVGVLLVLIPYTVAYWVGFLALLCREGNLYVMGWYVPAYFGFIAYMVLLFGFNAFVYTRANKVADGVVFMLAYAFLGWIAFSYVQEIAHTYTYWWDEESFSAFGGASIFTSNMTALIRGTQPRNWSVWMFLCPVVYGGAGYALLFLLLKKDRGEDAEQVCGSWFGYKVLLPLYLALWIGAFGGDIDILNLCIVIVCGVVATVLWQRKFRFSWKYWIMLAGAIALGLLLGWACQFTLSPATNLFLGIFNAV